MKEIQLEISRILWEHWDPISVNDTDCPRDEYDTYVLPVIGIMQRGDEGAGVAEYVSVVERESMGLAPVAERCAKVAGLCLAEYRKR